MLLTQVFQFLPISQMNKNIEIWIEIKGEKYDDKIQLKKDKVANMTEIIDLRLVETYSI